MGYKYTTTLNSGIPQDYGIAYWALSEAETFVAQTSFDLARFEIEAKRGNIYGPGYVKVILRATGTGSPAKPSGAVLSIGSTNGDVWATSPQWHSIDITPYSLSAGTRYAMEVQIGGDNNHNITLYGNHSKPSIGFDGTAEYGSGNTWGIEATAYAGSKFDFHFTTLSSGSVPGAIGYVGLAGENNLRLITVADAESTSDINPSLRLRDKSSNVVCADLVDTTDTYASRVRVMTSEGVKSWRESGA